MFLDLALRNKVFHFSRFLTSNLANHHYFLTGNQDHFLCHWVNHQLKYHSHYYCYLKQNLWFLSVLHGFFLGAIFSYWNLEVYMLYLQCLEQLWRSNLNCIDWKRCLIVLLRNQMIDDYVTVEKLILHHRSIRNDISRRGRKRVNWKGWQTRH